MKSSMRRNKQELLESIHLSQVLDMKGLFFQAALLLNLLSLVIAAPLFTKIDSETKIFGNKLWNVTQKGKNARPVYTTTKN